MWVSTLLNINYEFKEAAAQVPDEPNTAGGPAGEPATAGRARRASTSGAAGTPTARPSQLPFRAAGYIIIAAFRQSRFDVSRRGGLHEPFELFARQPTVHSHA